MIKLSEILRDSNYKLSQFSEERIKKFESKIFSKESKEKALPYFLCLARNKEVRLTPEEAMRQLFLIVLTEDFGYPL